MTRKVKFVQPPKRAPKSGLLLGPGFRIGMYPNLVDAQDKEAEEKEDKERGDPDHC